MHILFPAEPGTKRVDPSFEREREAASAAGCEVGLVYEKPDLTLGFTLPPGECSPVIFRGWMLSLTDYEELYQALWARGYHLINNPDEYAFTHHLPRWYPTFQKATPETVWFEWREGVMDNLYEVQETVKTVLGSGPYIIKDYVKSQKHYWKEACFIENVEQLPEVTKRFVELQGGVPEGGLVYRKYVHFNQVGKHPKSETPVLNEVRYFMLDNRPILGFPYWGPDEGGSAIQMPPAPPDLAERLVKSRFYTIDIAEIETTFGSGWIVIELGDGQVAGLPNHVQAGMFYSRLKERYTFT